MSVQDETVVKSSYIEDASLVFLLLRQHNLFQDLPPECETAQLTNECWRFCHINVRLRYEHIDKEVLNAWDEEAKAMAAKVDLPSLPTKSSTTLQTKTVSKSKTKKTKPLQRKTNKPKNDEVSFPDKISTMITDIEEHGKNEFVLARLPLYDWIGRSLVIAFDNRQPNFKLIGEIAQHLFVVLAPISTYGEVIALRLFTKAKKNWKDVIKFSSTTSLASILVQIDESEKLVSAEGNGTDDRAVKAALKKLRWGYVSLEEGSPGQKDLLEDEIILVDAASDQKLQNFFAPPHGASHLKNIVGTVARCSIVANVCANMPLRIAYHDLTDSSILDRARELHRRVHDGEELDLDAFVQVFLEDTISPALVSDDKRELAIQVTCELCKSLTNTDARNVCTKTFFNLFLEEDIVDTLSDKYDMPDLFGENGMGITLPLFAQSNVKVHCNFSRMKFFRGDTKINKGAIKKVVDKISFERNLVFENKEQLLSLQRLFELSVGG